MIRRLLPALAGFALLATPAFAQTGAPMQLGAGNLGDPWLLQLKPAQRQPVLFQQQPTRRSLFGGQANNPPMTLAPQPTAYPQPGTAGGRPIDPKFLPQTVAYMTTEIPGTIVIDTEARFLYLVLAGGQALRYGVGVGRPGFEWAGVHRITRKAEWPDWTPPPEMIARERARGRILPARMKGGPNNPLGARALYLGSTLYRIHGSNEPWTIGQAVSSGCIRMRNEDVTDLYGRVGVGTRVVVI